jgi:hypothetical protein
MQNYMTSNDFKAQRGKSSGQYANIVIRNDSKESINKSGRLGNKSELSGKSNGVAISSGS